MPGVKNAGFGFTARLCNKFVLNFACIQSTDIQMPSTRREEKLVCLHFDWYDGIEMDGSCLSSYDYLFVYLRRLTKLQTK